MSDGGYVAIDLGATSAKTACYRAGSVDIIPNLEGANQTPCAVWLNPHGQFVVGRKAKEALPTDPDNVQVNFIRDLGSDVEYTFPGLSRSMKSEDLTAVLLQALRLEAEQFTEQEIKCAVITVPLTANLPFCDATRRAASAAGFEQCLLIKDAVAAAVAGGANPEAADDAVLIYDFGGSRFNASIVQVRDGMLRVTAQAGDSDLGGVNLDRAIVETILIPALKSARPDLELAADSPTTRGLLAKLRTEGEAAKLRLGHANETIVKIPHDDLGQPIGFDCELRRSHLEYLAAPFVERSLGICRKLLTDNHIKESGISRVIPVGGMTAMPFVRQRIQNAFEGLAIPVDLPADPITTVARGAAIFAGMQSLPNVASATLNHAEFLIELIYQLVTRDPEPLISGIVCAHDVEEMDFAGFVIEFVEPQGWSSGKVGLSRDGHFTTTLSGESAQRNSFRIELSDAAGVRRTVVPDSITITVAAASIPEIVLPSSIGLALSNEVLPLFQKGTSLPARRRVSFFLPIALNRGQNEGSIGIPLVEGESHQADRNREIGIVAIQLEGLSQDVPAGTEIEMFLEIDDSMQFKVKIYVPILDAESEQRIALHLHSITSKDVAKSLLDTNTKFMARNRGTPEVPGGRIDDVHFSVTSPRFVLPGFSFVLDVWAHLKRQRQAVIEQAREAIAGGEVVIQSKGPTQVARGTVLTVLLKIDGMVIEDPQDTIFWKGEIGNARFAVTVPNDGKDGSRSGLATIHVDGIQIAKLYFVLMVGRGGSQVSDIPVQLKNHRKAFASYASQDRNDVLTSIQGMQKAAPGLDVFFDEANLRSGADWEQELKRVIPECDIFYLFWSAAAKESRWVDMEWRWALERRGIEFIDPVPLISPEEVPPPGELGGKHFKDWVLAYRRVRPKSD